MHYLAKQAARARTLAADVRPRLPARFDESPFEPVTVEQFVSPQLDAAPPPLGIPRTVIVENVLRRESERVQTIVERIMPRVGAPHVHEQIIERRVESQPFEERPRVVEPRIAPQQLPPRLERVREEAEPRTVRDERILRMIERTDNVVNIEVAPGGPVAPLPHPALPTRTTAEEPVTPQKQAIPVRGIERERVQLQTPRGDDAPPAIHVTIGRVDVRAVMTPDAPAKPARAPMQPSLSLEDYLKQREGRSR